MSETNESKPNAEAADRLDGVVSGVQYDCPESCNNCAGENEIFPVDIMDGHTLCEARTKCKACGFTDYWAYGFFESGTEMVGKSKKYSFDR